MTIAQVPLEEVSRNIQYGVTASSVQSGSAKLLRITDLTDVGVEWSAVPYCRPTKDLEKYELQDGDIVFARTGGTIGKSYIVNNPPPKAVFASYLIRVQPNKDKIIPEFLAYYMKSPFYWDFVASEQRGAAQPNINGTILKSLPIPVFDLRTQKIIVNKIETLFSEIDSGTQELQNAKQKLELYKQSILNSAIQGKLVPQDQKDEPASKLLEQIRAEKEMLIKEKKIKKEKPLPPIDPIEIPFEIPKGWEWVRLGNIFSTSTYGSSSKTNDDKRGVPVLRMGNIVDGTWDFNKLKYLPQKHDEFPDLLLQEGDLLFNRTNSAELVGKCAIYWGGFEKVSYASYLIRLRFNTSLISPDFFAATINGPFGRQWVNSIMAQQVGQANVNGTKLSNFIVPLPPTNEQRRIVEHLKLAINSSKEHFAGLENIESKKNSLKQSILKTAFEGKLI